MARPAPPAAAEYPSPTKYLHEKLPNKAKLGLYFNYGKVLDLIDDCIACSVDKR